ncbi:MAG: hypothetical protein CBC04_10545 [Verrucomicrobia bacterium TMED44]|nr:MAG: hypothetical protein CBC04_10545 [Verrucomicrobia bacterium TMED44]
MEPWQYAMGWILVFINTLCLLRLGILPMIFFAKNYQLYGKIFWVSCFIGLVFLASEIMLIRMLLHLGIQQ